MRQITLNLSMVLNFKPLASARRISLSSTRLIIEVRLCSILKLPTKLLEDSDDIDVLLSLVRKSWKIMMRKRSLRSSLEKSSGVGSSSSCNSERKRQKMKKMVRALRGIVPGGNEMNTVAVLDEAVQYLKSLKVELQKIGVENLNH
ncbi:unnamed protein product [Malus baccata var. baccata]